MAYLKLMLPLLVVVLSYLTAYPLRGRDAVLTGFAFSMVFFLSRFNALATVWLGAYPLVTIHMYQTALLALLLLLLGLERRPLRRRVAFPLPYLFLFVLLSFVSGLVNGGFDGVLAAIQAMVIAVVPALLAWALVEFVSATSASPADLRRLLVLPLGLVTPLFLVTSALLPAMFAQVLGWGLSDDPYGNDGFVRGWSPLGSTIDTGALVVIAYGFAMHEALVGRSRLHAAICALAAGSILFTASRSVMAMFVIFNLVYALSLGGRRFFRVAWLPALAILGLLGWALASGQVSFHRFLVTGDASSARRAASAQAAFDLTRSEPLLGHGPGLVYSEVRTTWIANPHQIPLVLEKKIGGLISAMEPHNLFLYGAAEHGVFGTMAYVVAMFGGLRFVGKRRAGEGFGVRSERGMFLGLWLGLFFLLTTGSWPFLTPQVSVFFWLFVFCGLEFAAQAVRESLA